MLDRGTQNYSKIVIVDDYESITSNTKGILWLTWNRKNTNKQNVICLTEYVETNVEKWVHKSFSTLIKLTMFVST